MRIVKAEDINLSNRFDILIKMYFLKSLQGKVDKRKGIEAYKFSLYSMNSFIEYDENYKPVKLGFEKFIDSFISLNENINKHGFDYNISLVPVSKDLTPLNGAHRVAIARYYNHEIATTIELNNLPVSWSYKYFLDKNYPKYILDSVFLNMIDFQSDIYCACFFPSSSHNHEDFIDILGKDAEILMDFSRRYNEVGKVILTSILYENEHWVGNRGNKYKGAKNKFENCFLDGEKVRYIIFKLKEGGCDLDRVIEIKDKLRKVADIGKHSVHITDNTCESKKLLKSVMSNSACHWINNQSIKRFENFECLLDKLEIQLSKINKTKDSFILVGSSVLSAYGIRDCNDLDVISLDLTKDDENVLCLGNHNKYFEDFGFDLSNLVGDQDEIFVYRGFNFLSIEKILDFKKIRSEEKDIEDIKLSRLFLSKDSNLKHKQIARMIFFVKNFNLKKELKKKLFKFGVIQW